MRTPATSGVVSPAARIGQLVVSALVVPVLAVTACFAAASAAILALAPRDAFGDTAH